MTAALMLAVVLVWLVALLHLAVTLALVRRVNQLHRVLGADASGPEPGRRAPRFEAPDLEGVSVSLEDFRGRGLALVFASPDCDGCRDLPAFLAALRADPSAVGVEPVLVSLASEAETRSFVDGTGGAPRTLVAPPASHPFRDRYGIRGTPSYCLIDPAGTVVASGLLRREAFHDEVALLAERAGAHGRREEVMTPTTRTA